MGAGRHRRLPAGPRTVMPCRFVPPYLLARVAPSSLVVDEALRAGRTTPVPTRAPALPVPGPAWTVHTAGNTTDLPGRAVRSAGDGASGDAAVDEAADGITAALALFAEVYGRASYDDAGAPVSLTVHYGRDYDNAFWDGTQLVFGDGDGQLFGRFTRPVDVLGHELTHAVTEHSAGLVYRDQPGALNESVSDAFAACLKQRLLGQTADQGDWLIGEGIFLPGVQARALRDMAAPGTAYDDPALGRDPQVGSMADFVVTSEDNGGVHLNSGIPNRAFQLAAVAIGGTTWEGAGRVWYAALTGGAVGADTDFAGFAAATIAAAGSAADAVGTAWETVGVTPSTSAPPPDPGSAAASSRRVAVRRTGGFAGLRTAGELDLDGDDPRGPELAALVDRVDLASVAGGPPQPDRFVYDFDLCGDAATVPEQHLTADLRRIADLLLESPRTDPRGAHWR
ncbi:protealysin inhibitor emfourin [Nocardioides sp. YIM 152315]|uniref:protealysin inhibitor emfourin n=1 Tax=Nocardioides sp. YIM 152315 TaxID=3031760 RepID=UPI0023DB89F5|nr:protealysin inhibitor emfourin [Nocardioides sp. YIM 152315]MDF1604949.1 M4 family metallopeptidase [Nocardioides sp. YIM 152315]